jgi:hypothetical protein
MIRKVVCGFTLVLPLSPVRDAIVLCSGLPDKFFVLSQLLRRVANREAITGQAKWDSCARRLRQPSASRNEGSVRTRSRAALSSSGASGRTKITPASVMGGAVSEPEKAMSGKPHAIPAIALPRREEIPPRTKNKTSQAAKRATTSDGSRTPSTDNSTGRSCKPLIRSCLRSSA